MCWIVAKEKNKEIPYEYMNTAQERNKDGYGVTWYADGELKTFKTLDYEEFVATLKAENIKEYACVIHLRKTSAGATNMENIHPFDVPGGKMFHNGTIFTLKPKSTYEYGKGFVCDEQSDTSAFAELLRSCTYERVEHMAPLITHIIGDTLNKLVFFNNDGTVTIFNKFLGIDELAEIGCWMSNDYHVPKPKTLAFVYGTLKKDYHNHHWLEGVPYVGDATLVDKWAMIQGPGFPYLLGKDEAGYHIKGEVYDASEDNLKNLDKLEGTPFHYHRKFTKANLNGEVVDVVLYVKTHVSDRDLGEEFIEEF